MSSRYASSPSQVPRLLVDGLNVIGTRPDGWWRDRRRAMRRLVAGLEAHAAATGRPVTVVFDGRPFHLPAAATVTVVFAPGAGPGAADDEIVRLVAGSDHAEVVTSDGALAARVRHLGAGVLPAGAFRRRLDESAGAGT